jgi:hypothetical protein
MWVSQGLTAEDGMNKFWSMIKKDSSMKPSLEHGWLGWSLLSKD